MITGTDFLITVIVASAAALSLIPACYIALRIRRKDMQKAKTLSQSSQERLR